MHILVIRCDNCQANSEFFLNKLEGFTTATTYFICPDCHQAFALGCSFLMDPPCFCLEPLKPGKYLSPNDIDQVDYIEAIDRLYNDDENKEHLGLPKDLVLVGQIRKDNNPVVISIKEELDKLDQGFKP